MGVFEGFADLLNLSPRVLGAEINRRPHGNRPHIEGLFDRGEGRLVVHIRVAQVLVVIEFDNEGNTVGVLSRHCAQHPEGGGDRVTAAFQRQFDNGGRIEVNRVGRKGSRAGVLDALIHRQNRQITATGETAAVEQRLHIAHHHRAAIHIAHNAADIICPRQMQLFTGNTGAGVAEQIVCFTAEEGLDVGHVYLYNR